MDVLDGFRRGSTGQSNYLLWGPPGSGKTYLVERISKLLGAAVDYAYFNLMETDEQSFRRGVEGVRTSDRPTICFVDEIDSKLQENWPDEVLLPLLEPAVARSSWACFILAGSQKGSISEMMEVMKDSREKAEDLLDRIPASNRLTVPPLGLGDRLLVVLNQMVIEADKSSRVIREVDKLALLYILISDRLSTARQLRDFAQACIRRLTPGEDRILYDTLFRPGDTTKYNFQQPRENKGFMGCFVVIESAPPETASIDANRPYTRHQDAAATWTQGFNVAKSSLEFTDNTQSGNLEAYLSSLHDRLGWIRVQKAFETTPSVVRLTDVFEPLMTRERVAVCEDVLGKTYRVLPKDVDAARLDADLLGNWQLVPMGVFEALSFYRCVALIGGVGSGKSTTLSFLAMSLADPPTGDEGDWLKLRTAGWALHRRFPVLVSLPEFASSRMFGSTRDSLLDFLSEHPFTRGVIASVRTALETGRAVFVFDEVEGLSSDERRQALSAVSDLSRTFPLSRFVFSCRERDFAEVSTTGAGGFRPVTISPLSDDVRTRFIDRWFEAIKRADPSAQPTPVLDLKTGILNLDAAELAESPLLLAQMVLLASHDGYVPGDRVALYSTVTDRLISTSLEYANFVRHENLRAVLETLASILSHVAFLILTESSPPPRGITGTTVRAVFEQHFASDPTLASRVYDHFVQRGRLLIDLGDDNLALELPHNSFVEYLAARHVSTDEALLSRVAELTKSDHVRWHRVYSIAARLSSRESAIRSIRRLCALAIAEREGASSSEMDWYPLWTAAEAASELTPLPSPTAEETRMLRDLKAAIHRLIESNGLTPRERSEVAALLSKIGDARDGVISLEPFFLPISPGPVMLGGDLITHGDTYIFDIPYRFEVSKYPVTNAQYARFLAERPTQRLPKDEAGLWNVRTRSPGAKYLNHPLVGLSWQEATTYCGWLTEKLVQRGRLTGGYVVRLPTDAEWLKVCRGGVTLGDGSKNPNPTRLYPWGSYWIDGYANVPEAREPIGQTTPVGIFPLGRAPCGALDVCGNVMEWTSTSWGSTDVDAPAFRSPYDPHDGREAPDASGLRIARGGSWLFSEGSAKCACRLDPTSRFPDTGFRVVMAPRLSSLP